MEIVQRHAADDPRVRFIANPDNPGFAVACNQGAADCAHDAPLAGLRQSGLPRRTRRAGAPARHAIATDGDVLLGADLVDEAGVRDAGRAPAGSRFRRDASGLLRATGGASRLATLPSTTRARCSAVEAVSGALMLLPRALFDRLGGFDEGYRLHAEDLDLCRRAREAGAMVAVANDVHVVHVRGVSSRSRPVFVEWHKHRGLWRYFRKFEAPRRGMAARGRGVRGDLGALSVRGGCARWLQR